MHADKPWNLEPDRKKWIDRETGLTCAIMRVPEIGHLCGYVRLPAGSALLRRLRAYSRIPGCTFHGKMHRKYSVSHHSLGRIVVHGGITWADSRRNERGFWIGFDCAHYMDLSPLMNESMKRCGIPTTGGTYRDFAYVARECAYLAKQLKAVL